MPQLREPIIIPKSSHPSLSQNRLIRTSLTFLLVMVLLYTAYVARSLLIPVVFAVLFHFVLMPVRRVFDRLRIKPALSAAIILAVVVSVSVVSVVQLSRPALTWVAKMPESLRTVERKFRQWRAPVAKVSQTAEQVEAMTDIDKTKEPEVVIKEPSLFESVLTGGGALLAGAIVTVLLLYFLLAYRDVLLKRIVEVVPSRANKDHVRILMYELEENISTYLVTLTAINVTLGVTEGVLMYLVGMPNPVLWGAMAGVFNFVPFLCDIGGTSIITLVSVFTFDHWTRVILPPLLFYGVTAIEGSFLTPMILGKRFTLNPLMIFTWLMFWGWLWGPAGALLAVPMLTTLKIFCDRFNLMTPVGKLLAA